MIVSDKYKTIFVAIPKTSTRSVYQFFNEELNGRIIRDHEKNIPDNFKDYYKFTIIRNPYDRVISSWWSTTQRGNDSKFYILRTLKTDTSFLNFCKNLDILEKNHPNVPHVTPQIEWIKNNKFDKIIKYENLNEEWLNLPFNKNHKPLVHINATTKVEGKRNEIAREPSEKYLSKKTIELINKFYKEDFDNLGFDRL